VKRRRFFGLLLAPVVVPILHRDAIHIRFTSCEQAFRVSYQVSPMIHPDREDDWNEIKRYSFEEVANAFELPDHLIAKIRPVGLAK
jgi:hypothetical protein